MFRERPPLQVVKHLWNKPGSQTSQPHGQSSLSLGGTDVNRRLPQNRPQVQLRSHPVDGDSTLDFTQSYLPEER